MASFSVETARSPRTAAMLLACVADNGSAAHPYSTSDALLRGPDSICNLADAVHFLCALHGQAPGILEHAATRSADLNASAWLNASGQVFARERFYLAQLAVSAGPLPGTPGGGASHAAVIGQRSAIATLARSERKGCALGAAVALVADWAAIRAILDTAAERFGMEPPEFGFGDPAELRKLIDTIATSASIERALMFGAEQIAVQHRGLWDLLETRAEARRDS